MIKKQESNTKWPDRFDTGLNITSWNACISKYLYNSIKEFQTD